MASNLQILLVGGPMYDPLYTRLGEDTLLREVEGEKLRVLEEPRPMRFGEEGALLQ